MLNPVLNPVQNPMQNITQHFSNLSSAQNFAEVVKATLELAMQISQAHAAKLWIPQPGGDLLERGSIGRGFSLFDTFETCLEVYITRQTQIARDHAHFSLGQGDVWAVLELIYPEHASLDTLEPLLGTLGFALEACFQREKGEQQSDRASLLSSFSHALGGSLELEQVQKVICAFGVENLALERAFIGLFEGIEDSAAVTGPLFSHGFGDSLFDQPLRLVSDSYLKLVKLSQPIMVRDHRDHHMPLARTMSVHGMQACIAVPLLAKGRNLGVLYLDTAQSGAVLSDLELNRALWLAEHAATALDNALKYGEETRKRRAAESLREVSSVLASSLHLGDILERILEQSRQLFGAGAVAIFQLDDDGKTLRIRSSVGLELEFIRNVRYRLRIGVVGQAVAANKPVLMPNMQEHFRQHPQEWGKQSYARQLMERGEYPFRGVLGLPLVSRAKVFGGMALYFEEAIKELREEDVYLLEVFAGQAALAIENARLFEELEEQEAQYRLLAEAAQDLILTTDLKGRVTYANPATQNVLGYRQLELVGRQVLDFIPPLLQAESFAAWRQCLRSRGKASVWLDGQAKAKDGELAFLELNLNALTRDGEIVGVLAVGRDLTEEHRLALEIQSRGQALRQAEERRIELRSYLALFTQAQEEERRRIARELHDDTAQVLVAIGRRLDRLAKVLPDLELKARTEDIRADVDAAITSVRRFSHNLRPSVLDDLGLLSALEQLAERAQTPTRLEVSGLERRLNSNIELTLFRMVQESLTNIDKHAQASSAAIRVSFLPKRTEVRVIDDGVGFHLRDLGELLLEGHMGLLGLRERVELLGGTLEISSAPGEGTEMFFCFPD